MESNNRNNREQSNITKMKNDIIDLKFHVAKVYDAAAENRKIQESDKAEILKSISKIEDNYKTHEAWLNDLQNELDDLTRRLSNRF